MYHSIYGLMIGLLISMPCFAQQSVVGTYKLVSFATEVGDQPLDLGGYIINFSPTNHEGSSFVDLSMINSVGRLVY